LGNGGKTGDPFKPSGSGWGLKDSDGRYLTVGAGMMIGEIVGMVVKMVPGWVPIPN